MSRGFITIATGKEKYFQLAVNLLNSYRRFSKSPLPFALLTDKENEYTARFDDVLILENPTCSYMDKISLLKNLPYDETIFIDADCLAYKDLNEYFTFFEGGSAMSCFGGSYPINAQNGWFKIENAGKYRDRIRHIAKLHGGMMYFRKTSEEDRRVLEEMYEICMDVISEYTSYQFFYFTQKPADEPIYSFAMSVLGCRSVDYQARMYAFFPASDLFRCNMLSGYLHYMHDGQVCRGGEGMLVHFGNYNTVKKPYTDEVKLLNRLTYRKGFAKWFPCLWYGIGKTAYGCYRFVRSQLGKIKRKIFG